MHISWDILYLQANKKLAMLLILPFLYVPSSQSWHSSKGSLSLYAWLEIKTWQKINLRYKGVIIWNNLLSNGVLVDASLSSFFPNNWNMLKLMVLDEKSHSWNTSMILITRYVNVLSHMPLCISMISGVCVQGMWNAQVKGQVTETHRLKVNSHCDTALFISMYDITMVQP